MPTLLRRGRSPGMPIAGVQAAAAPRRHGRLSVSVPTSEPAAVADSAPSPSGPPLQRHVTFGGTEVAVADDVDRAATAEAGIDIASPRRRSRLARRKKKEAEQLRRNRPLFGLPSASSSASRPPGSSGSTPPRSSFC